MAQRVLDPGEIQAAAAGSIPRLRLPDPAVLFARRAARLRKLAAGSALGEFLDFLAVLADAQHAALQHATVERVSHSTLERSRAHGMPPLHPSGRIRAEEWRAVLNSLCDTVQRQTEAFAPVRAIAARVRSAPVVWLEGQAGRLLLRTGEALDGAAAPLIMAALQVHWTALAAATAAAAGEAAYAPLDIAALCPVCGGEPVAGVVRATVPHQGYRYLHCALCASEWHMVRVQCSGCGAVGKDIAYHTVTAEAAPPAASADEAVRAETCESCRGYRKMLYEEKDMGVDPVADDLATLRLDLLLGESGYHRLSGNPFLWLSEEH